MALSNKIRPKRLQVHHYSNSIYWDENIYRVSERDDLISQNLEFKDDVAHMIWYTHGKIENMINPSYDIN